MSRKLVIVLTALTLIAAACGSSNETESTTDAGVVASDPPATDPPTTDPPDPEPDPLLELARSVVGSWTGEWNNTTFGSTGPISGDIVLDEEAMELTINTDIGGNVFGASDPDPELLVLPIRAGDHTGSSPTFGDWTLSIDETGGFSMVASNLPALPGATFTLEGALSDTGIDATYVVDFGSGEPAVGVVTITKS